MKKSYLLSFFLLCSISLYITPNFAQTEVGLDQSKKTEIQNQKINLNTADVATLTQAFKGIGKKRAEAIVHYREEQGEFKSVLDLAHVSGLGLAFVNRHLTALEALFTVS